MELNYKILLKNGKEIDEKEMIMLIINIIRLSEKFNKSSSKLIKIHVDKAFENLGIDRKEINRKEFEHYKMFNYAIKTPTIVESIYKLIEGHLDDADKNDFVLDFASDVLKIFYCWRSKIYDE